MTQQNLFWLIVGLMLGASTVVLLARLLRAPSAVPGWRLRVSVLAGAALLIAGAIGLYLHWGRPELIGARTRVQPVHGSPSARAAGSLDAAAERLAARLAAGGGTPEDWELLAQSYDRLGRSADAEAVRSRRVLSRMPAANASPDVQAKLAAAEALRRKRDYPGAVAAFEAVIARGGMTADAWADYADALASRSGGRLSGEPARAIEQALKLEPSHLKALWLEASLALEEKRFAEARDLWGRLRALVPEDSTDARIIEGNLAEARELLARGSSKAGASGPVAAPRASVAIDGVVEIDPALLAGVARGSVLFVFAKAVDAPGPPLAVWRTTPARWPVAFRLDDSMAMLPSRKLSDFDSVVVEARLSRSGVAEARAGDLSGPGVRLRPADNAPIRLRIASKTT